MAESLALFLLPEEKEHGLDVFYGGLGVGEKCLEWISENHVFYAVFGVAARSVWIEPVAKPCVLQCLLGCEETRLD